MKTTTTLLVFFIAMRCVASPSGAIERLTLERTTCYGWCAAYTVTVSGNGVVQYDGLHFVKVKGKRTKQLTAAAMRELREEIDRVGYFGLRDNYISAEDGCGSTWTDNPAANTSVTIGGKVKTVHHYLGCREKVAAGQIGETYPRELGAFEDAIDRIVATSQWIGTERERARNR